jgi:DNA modification methylase
VWRIPTQPFPEAHFATFSEKLVEPMIKAGCPQAGIVLDPFIGSGTVAVVARKLGRQWLGIELSEDYIKIAEERLKQEHLGI